MGTVQGRPNGHWQIIDRLRLPQALLAYYYYSHAYEKVFSNYQIKTTFKHIILLNTCQQKTGVPVTLKRLSVIGKTLD